MPAKSRAQQRLAQIAEHDPEAVRGRNRSILDMSQKELHTMASGSMRGKPEHVRSRDTKSHSYDWRRKRRQR